MRAAPLVEILGGDALAVRWVDALARHPRRTLFDFGGEVEASMSTNGARHRCHVGYALSGALDVAGRLVPKRRRIDRIREHLLPFPEGLTGLVGVVRDGPRPRIKLYIARGDKCSEATLQGIAGELATLLDCPPLAFPVGRTDVVAIEFPLDGGQATLKAYQTFADASEALALVPERWHERVNQIWAAKPEDAGRCPIMVVVKSGGPSAIQLRVGPEAAFDFAPRCPPGTLPTYLSLAYQTGDVTAYYVVPGAPLDSAPVDVSSPSVDTVDMPRALDISIGETCNNNCTFCINPTESWAPLASTSSLRRVIKETADRGYKRLSFLGGEPTLHPDLPALIEHALACGYDEVMLITNGRKLAEPGFAQRLYDAGLRRALFMLLSHKAAVHDGITRRKGSLREALKGVLMARKAGLVVGANIPITGSNVSHLAETAGALTRFGIRDFAYLYLTAYGNVLSNPGVLAPPEETAAQLRRALERLDPMDVNVHIDNFPFCYLPGHEHRIITEMANPWREIAYPSGAIVDVSEVYRFRKRRLPICDGCEWDAVCGGVQDVDQLDDIAKALKAGVARAEALR